MRRLLIASPRGGRGRRTGRRIPSIEGLEPKILLAVTTQAVTTITTASVNGQNFASPGTSALETDAAGNSYVVGRFNGNLNLAGSLRFSATADSSQYVAKLDPKNQPLWVVYLKAPTGSDGPTISDVAVAKDGSVYLAIVNAAGTQQPYDFYTPITPQNNTAIPQVQNNPGNQNETFSEVVKLDSSGNLVWRTGDPYVARLERFGKPVFVPVPAPRSPLTIRGM